jgi:two-component system, OmpR family, KDP operon response regulator KdpE
MTPGRILVCDPSSQARRALQVVLRTADYKAQTTATGKEALFWVDRDRPQAVILELDLPDMSGIDVCRELRRRGQMAILVVSRIEAEGTKIKALEVGVDDYITKPFSAGELLARLAARLRAAPSGLRIETDGLIIDLSAQQVTRAGQAVHLTATEFALLRALVTSRGAVTHRTLATQVWGPAQGDIRDRMRTHIQNLRAKLDPGNGTSVIRTEAGIGYSFAPSLPIDTRPRSAAQR